MDAMKPVAPEMPRPLQVDRIPALGSHETVEATAEERAAIARRLELPALHGLKAKLHAMPWRGGLKLSGQLTADLEQTSVVSLEAFRSKVACPVERYFMPASAISADSAEEVDAIEAGCIDMGEVVVETLALELDPYPRMPGEAFNPPEEPDKPPKGTPFDALRKLKP